MWEAVSNCLIFLSSPSMWGLGSSLATLRFQLGLLGCDVLFKCVSGGSATLHDTTSLLRVLTVGVCKSDPNMPIPGYRFRSEQFKLGY